MPKRADGFQACMEMDLEEMEKAHFLRRLTLGSLFLLFSLIAVRHRVDGN